MRIITLVSLLLLMTACTLNQSTGSVATLAPTADNSGQGGGLPVIGEPGLQPSGAGPCIIMPAGTPPLDVLVYSAPDANSQPLAILSVGNGAVTFEYNPADWYAINFYVDNQPQVGWVFAIGSRVDGDCAYLYPQDTSGQGGGLQFVGEPGLTSSGAAPCVVIANGDNVLLYAEPNHNAQPLAHLGTGRGVAAFEYNPTGWYAANFYLDNQPQVGWIDAVQIRTDGDCARLISS